MKAILITLFFFFASALANGFHRGYPLSPENTHLVTMRRAESLNVVTCVSESRDPRLCEQYNKCSMLMPPRLLTIFKKCRESITGSSWPQCYSQGPVFSPAPVRAKIFECINSNTHQETPEEKLAIVQAEKCFRDLYSRNCMHQPGQYGLY